VATGAMASIRATELGISFLFGSERQVITPLRAKISLHATETWGLRGATFEVGPGEGVALLGPTGSGKTSLLRAVAGVLPADEGGIEVGGRVGSMLSTDAGLLPALTGRENAMLLSVLAGLSRAEVKVRLDAMRERSGLGDAFDRPASSYSQGMLARLAFTAASACDPDLIVIDEVHEAFDHAFREVLEETAQGLMDRGGIVVAAGHHHEILRRLCSRALLLDRGALVADGPFEEVRGRYLGEPAASG
jgi:ABC-type polysaccharide/polyol phosphate transport system ATPase subunit